MLAYIKRRMDFRTAKSVHVLDYSMAIDSVDNDVSKFTVKPADMGHEDAGDWFIFAGTVLIVDTVKPGAKSTEVRCRSAKEAFSRELFYSAPGEDASMGAFIRTTLLAEWKWQQDPVYAMPYLDVSGEDTELFLPPEVDSDGIYSFEDYLLIAEEHGIRLQFSVFGDLLRVSVGAREAKTGSVVFGAGRCQLVSQAYSSGSIGKITTIQAGKTEDWYLAADGSVSTTPPNQRADGEWIFLKVGDKDEVAEVVRRKFDRKKASHKIEFWSKHRSFEVGDSVNFRIEGNVVSGRITYIGSKSGDTRYYYKSGELAITLTDKLRTSQNVQQGSSVAAVGPQGVGIVSVTLTEI